MTETPPDYSPGDTTPVAPALGPHAASANVVSVPASPDVTPPAAAPSTPPWLLSSDAPSPPACPSTDACPVCLCEFPSHAHGPEMPFSWPRCGHALHLGCVAHLVANVRDLRCPTCRAPWPPQAADAFTHACRAHGVPAPQPAPDHDTTSRQYHEAVAPRAPPHILPFCCPRLFLADSAHAASDAAWQELPDRHMHWAPVHLRQAGRWAPEWVCLRCNATVNEHHPLLQGVPAAPVCPAHGPRRLALDLRESSRGWVCCRGSPPEVLPCPGQRIPTAEVPDAAAHNPSPAPPAPPTQAGATAAPAAAAWCNQGPPDAPPHGRTHSWLFVTLLHAAVGRLHPAALAAWEAHALYAPLWQRGLTTLRHAAPVEPAALVHALHTLQQLATEEGRALPVPEAQLLLTLAAEANTLPVNTLVHLLWVWQLVTMPDGYIPATVQEALLHVFMGERAASALLRDVAALPRNGLPPVADDPPPQPYRGGQTALHGHPRAANAEPHLGPPSASPSSSTSDSSSSSSSTPGEADQQPRPDAPSHGSDPGADARLRYRASLANLDPFVAEDILAQPCRLFRVPPQFCKGVLRSSLRLALDLIRSCARAPAGPELVRAWKLWFFLPRMLLHRPAGGAHIPKAVFLARFQAFSRGDWASLLQDAISQPWPEAAAGHRVATSGDARARRAVHLAHLGELSAARQALTADPLAPSTDATFEQLSDPSRRPPEPYGPLAPDLLDWEPPSPVALDSRALLSNLRRARKGAAPGPSGFTAEIARVVLDDEESSQAFVDVATLLAQAQIPPAILPAFGLGRVVALTKPSGGTRGLVVGDFFRRIVARTLAQQFAGAVEEACPHQYALGNRAGLDALVHAVQARCAHDPNLTVVSLDASAAYDGISRQSILQELRSLPAAAALLPFARLWLGRPSSFVWQQGATTRHLRQAEGVEQGDPLSPALFCLGLQPALTDLQRELREDLGERVLAYLDDVTILAAPERVLHLVRRFEHHLARHTRLRLNVDKTAIWNGAGLTPDGLGELSPASRVWFGDPALEPSSRGILLLGTPFGEPQFVAKHLQTLSDRHETLLSSLPGLGDTQVSWLLLLYTAAPRAQFALRTLPPRLTRDFAHAHDARVLTVLSALLLAEGPSPLPPAAARVAQLALRHGGLGLRSAALHAPAAYWASWADAVAVLRVRDAPLVNSLVQALDNRSVLEWSPVQDLVQASDALAEAGFEVPR